ncbi:hypothetical protein Ancab_030282, partial [Ancistrocladus abbreviatus]
MSTEADESWVACSLPQHINTAYASSKSNVEDGAGEADQEDEAGGRNNHGRRVGELLCWAKQTCFGFKFTICRRTSEGFEL